MGRFLLTLVLITIPFCAFAQTASPFGVVLSDGGKELCDTITPGSSYTGSAPILINFVAGIDADESIYSHVAEWRIYTNGNEDSPVRVYYEDSVQYTFDETESYGVKLYVTFTNKNDGSSFDVSSDEIRIGIATSTLKVPNAFSPNGDGVHDVLCVSYQSIVKFDAYVFNRWGQQLYHWGLDEIDGGWDGTYNGDPVKDGVYFILVEAQGADGVKYNVKKAVNLLRGYTLSTNKQ